MTDPLLRVRDLTVRFGTGRFGDVTAVRDIGFDLEPGRCVALVGESGSGKSVTGRSLLGLTGPGATVTAGELSLRGRDLRALTPAQWREVRGRDVGLVLQDALVSLDPLVPVGPQVSDTLRVHERTARAERRERAIELLAQVGVPEPELRAAQYPHELSGGLRQRALIASAVAGSPAVLVADEPTTALDVTVQAQVLALLAELRRGGTGLLLISHDLAVVASLADEIIILREGEVVERGTADEVLRFPRHEYTRELLAAVPSATSRGTRLSRQPVAVFDRAPRPRDEAVSDTPALEATGLTMHYPRPGGGLTRVLDDVSFTLPRGATLGIVGESGSGKSTTASIALGLLTPDAGEVRLHGRPWSTLPERRRRRLRHSIQFISQDPLGSFDPRDHVEGLLTEALATVRVPRGERRDRAAHLLEQVGLGPAVLSRHPLELSGGQRQRVAISRALATEPDILVCDEPVSALDVSIQAQVLDLLGDMQRQLAVSLLFISHDLGVIRHVTDDVVVMRHGRIVERGRTEDVFCSPQHPYTRELIGAIPVL